MDYLFDDILLYRSHEGVLLIVDEDDSNAITLTPVLNRMLILLIEKKGQLVTREEFLEKVWDNHGRIASSNTLTQYISTLRKIFFDHLKKECVITLPKQGYMFSPDVSVVPLKASGIPPPTAEAEIKKDLSKEMPTPEIVDEKYSTHSQARVKATFKKTKIIFSLAIPIFIGFILLFSWHVYNQGDNFTSGNIGKCKIHLLPDYFNGSESSKLDMSSVEEHVKKFGLDCVDGAEFYFYRKENVATPLNSFSLLSRCKKDNNSIDECITTRISGK